MVPKKRKTATQEQTHYGFFVCVWNSLDAWPCVYRFVLLSGHVRPEDTLHGEGGVAFAPVAGSLYVHALVLLDDDGGSGAAQKHRQAENDKNIYNF